MKNCSCCKSFGLVALNMTWRACASATSGCPISVSANTCPNNNSITSREDSPRSWWKRDNRHHKVDSVLYFDKSAQLLFLLYKLSCAITLGVQVSSRASARLKACSALWLRRSARAVWASWTKQLNCLHKPSPLSASAFFFWAGNTTPCHEPSTITDDFCIGFTANWHQPLPCL